ncbi:hypothetical protein [Acidisphaera sp. S103]|nr:hypothetical protein [Acidisphaera sp. S103]
MVTWSFATGAGSSYNPLTGSIQAQYQEAIEQATPHRPLLWREPAVR